MADVARELAFCSARTYAAELETREILSRLMDTAVGAFQATVSRV